MKINTVALMSGNDIPIPELQTTIHQPKVREIALIGEEEYFYGIQMFCINKEIVLARNKNAVGASDLENMNDFQIFMALLGEESKELNKKEIILSCLILFFPNYTVQFSPLGNGIFFSNQSDQTSFMVNETNFNILKDAIQAISGVDNAAGGQNSGFNPKGKKAAAIAAKLMRGREKAMHQRGEKSSSVLSRYVSIITVGLQSMSLENCLNLTVFQLYDLLERFNLYVNWDLDIKSRLAGGKPDSKPDDWMKSLH